MPHTCNRYVFSLKVIQDDGSMGGGKAIRDSAGETHEQKLVSSSSPPLLSPKMKGRGLHFVSITSLFFFYATLILLYGGTEKGSETHTIERFDLELCLSCYLFDKSPPLLSYDRDRGAASLSVAHFKGPFSTLTLCLLLY